MLVDGFPINKSPQGDWNISWFSFLAEAVGFPINKSPQGDWNGYYRP